MTVHTHNGSKSLTKDRRMAARAAALLVAGFFVLHGLAHLVGVKGIWGIGTEITDTSTYLGGLDPHSALFVVLGGVWVAACVLFVTAAAGIVLRRSWWLPVAFAAAGISLVLCVLWRDAAIVGLVVNAVILAGLTAWTLTRRAARAH